MNGTTLVVGITLLVAGLIVGTIYGQKIEQKAIAAALAEFSRTDAAAKAAVERFRYRLLTLKSDVETYLRKHLG